MTELHRKLNGKASIREWNLSNDVGIEGKQKLKIVGIQLGNTIVNNL